MNSKLQRTIPGTENFAVYTNSVIFSRTYFQNLLAEQAALQDQQNALENHIETVESVRGDIKPFVKIVKPPQTMEAGKTLTLVVSAPEGSNVYLNISVNKKVVRRDIKSKSISDDGTLYHFSFEVPMEIGETTSVKIVARAKHPEHPSIRHDSHTLMALPSALPLKISRPFEEKWDHKPIYRAGDVVNVVCETAPGATVGIYLNAPLFEKLQFNKHDATETFPEVYVCETADANGMAYLRLVLPNLELGNAQTDFRRRNQGYEIFAIACLGHRVGLDKRDLRVGPAYVRSEYPIVAEALDFYVRDRIVFPQYVYDTNGNFHMIAKRPSKSGELVIYVSCGEECIDAIMTVKSGTETLWSGMVSTLPAPPLMQPRVNAEACVDLKPLDLCPGSMLKVTFGKNVLFVPVEGQPI